MALLQGENGGSGEGKEGRWSRDIRLGESEEAVEWGREEGRG